jgi:hypothetical protein
MTFKLRVSGEQPGCPSTWAELTVAVEKPWVALSADSVSLITGVSLRPADARKLAAALCEAADRAELPPHICDFPP